MAQNKEFLKEINENIEKIYHDASSKEWDNNINLPKILRKPNEPQIKYFAY